MCGFEKNGFHLLISQTNLLINLEIQRGNPVEF
jgi:hypothetical protein